MHNHSEPRDMSFANRASSYDKGLEGRLSRRFYELILNNIQLPKEARILDVGCGTGALLRMIADQTPIDGYGIDSEPNMVREAQKQCPAMNIRQARCEKTPFEGGSFDALITCMAYHHFADKPGFAKEAARILKPGGRLYIAEVRVPTPIRQFANAIFHHRSIAGESQTPEQIVRTFAEHGFRQDGYARKGFAQLFILELVGM